jgi:hypothetical protein
MPRRSPGCTWIALLLVVGGMALSRRRVAQRAPVPLEDILPPTPQTKLRAKEDRGLAADEIIAAVACEYLTWQRQQWPKLAELGLLNEPTDRVIRDMIDDFKARHRGTKVGVDAVSAFVATGLPLFGEYGRFSCDGSKPVPITDQLVNCLKLAAEKGVFHSVVIYLQRLQRLGPRL